MRGVTARELSFLLVKVRTSISMLAVIGAFTMANSVRLPQSLNNFCVDLRLREKFKL